MFFLNNYRANEPTVYDKDTARYVAIGDSYSSGEGATPEESWPSLLTKHLQDSGIKIELIANPSVTGFTTQQAIDLELPIYKKSDPTFATLLIGANDWVRGVNENTFRKNLIVLIDEMQKDLPDKNKMLIITIPDFSVTPQGLNFGNGLDIAEGIAGFNEIIKEEAGKRNIKVVDIYPLSQSAKDDPELTASDGLHPSAKHYALWEEVVYPQAYELLKK